MLGKHVEATCESGAFPPSQPFLAAGRHRVESAPTESEMLDREADYEPLPLRDCKTLRVRFKRAEDFEPLPYSVGADDMEEP